MARMARVVVRVLPTSRHAARESQTDDFHEVAPRLISLFLGEWSQRCAVQISVYCLIPQSLHFIAVPESEDGLRRPSAEAHKDIQTE